MAALAERWAGRSSTNTAWSGLKMFRESQLPPDDPGRQSVCAHFEKNLEAIVRSGIRAGAPVVLSTMAVNLKDCGPFASLPTSRLGNDARTNFTHWLQLGQRNEAAGDWTAARDAYTQAAAIDPRFAELQFRLGECLVRLDRPSDARAALERACASDAPCRSAPTPRSTPRSSAWQPGTASSLSDLSPRRSRGISCQWP